MDSLFLAGLLGCASFASFHSLENSAAFPLYAAVLLGLLGIVASFNKAISFPGTALGIALPAALAHLQLLIHGHGRDGTIAATREVEILPFVLCIATALPASRVASVAIIVAMAGVCHALHASALWLVLLGAICGLTSELRGALRLSHFELCLFLYGIGVVLADVITGCPNLSRSGAGEEEKEGEEEAAAMHVVKLGLVATVVFGLSVHWLSTSGWPGCVSVDPRRGTLTLRSYAFLSAATLAFLGAMLYAMQRSLQQNPLRWVYDLCLVKNQGAAGWQMLVWCLLILATTPLARLSLVRWKWPAIVTRKLFHFLAAIMFVPPLLMRGGQRGFLALAFGVALCAFFVVEFARALVAATEVRSFVPLVDGVIDYFGLFTKKPRERQYVIWDHITLLLGCATPVWLSLSIPSPLQSPQLKMPLLPFIGFISIGLGDAVAAIVGIMYGQHKWTRASGRSIEGSAAAAAAMLLAAGLLETCLARWGAGGETTTGEGTTAALTIFLITLVEAFTIENDNLVVVLFGVGFYESFSVLRLRLVGSTGR